MVADNDSTSWTPPEAQTGQSWAPPEAAKAATAPTDWAMRDGAEKPTEEEARGINQAFLTDRLGMKQDAVIGNYQSIKDSYAKQALNKDGKDITDTEL